MAGSQIQQSAMRDSTNAPKPTKFDGWEGFDGGNWVIWQDKGKPKSAKTGREKAWNLDPATLEEAKEFIAKKPDYSLGLLFQPGDGLVGFDIDGGRNPETGELEPWVVDVLKIVDSYTEVSVSGTGVKIVGRTSAESRTGPRKYVIDLEFEGSTMFGDHDKAEVEIFFASKYFALTGDTLEGREDINEIDLEAVEQMLKNRFGSESPAAEEPIEPPTPPIAKPRFDGPSASHQEAYNRETRIADILSAKGWTTVSGTNHLKRPGKTDDGVSATINVGDDGVERLTVWTTNGGPLKESGACGHATTYDAWSVFAHLYHNGDFSTAKRSFLSARPDLDPNRSERPEIEFADPPVWTEGAKAMAEEPMIKKPPASKSDDGDEVLDQLALARIDTISRLKNGPIGKPVGQITRGRQLRPAIVDGLCREGEVVNLISASKIGKSLLVHDLAFAVAAGETWLDSFRIPKARRVLILDNELHEETLEWRLEGAAKRRGADLDEAGVEYNSVRGGRVSIFDLYHLLNRIEPEAYGLIILDAFYRFLPEGTNENDNGQMTTIYNAIDEMVKRLRAAIILVHHSSKGNQSQKSRVDVGSGAGAMARAADSHVVIRDHQSPGLQVLEAETRSFKTPQPISIERVDGGLQWIKSSAEPVVATSKTGATKEQKKLRKDTLFDIIKANEPIIQGDIKAKYKKQNSAGISNQTLKENLDALVDEELIDFTKKGNSKEFRVSENVSKGFE